MNEPKPTLPPIPYATPESSKNPSSYTTYDRVADTVGMVPNVRGKDNLYQLLAGGIGAGVGVITGVIIGVETAFLIACGIGGFIVGVVLYGIYLGIVGMVRGARGR